MNKVGKRTVLRTVEPREKAGSRLHFWLAYRSERSKVYVYSTVRNLGILYVTERLE